MRKEEGFLKDDKYVMDVCKIKNKRILTIRKMVLSEKKILVW